MLHVLNSALLNSCRALLGTSSVWWRNAQVQRIAWKLTHANSCRALLGTSSVNWGDCTGAAHCLDVDTCRQVQHNAWNLQCMMAECTGAAHCLEGGTCLTGAAVVLMPTHTMWLAGVRSQSNRILNTYHPYPVDCKVTGHSIVKDALARSRKGGRMTVTETSHPTRRRGPTDSATVLLLLLNWVRATPDRPFVSY
jgi:hypothetical protein